MKLLSALSILLAVAFVSSSASGTGATSRSLAGGRAGRIVSDSSTAIDDGDDDDDDTFYGGGTSQTLISASFSSSSSSFSSSEDYRSVRPRGFWNENGDDDDDDLDDDAITGGSELAQIATVVTTPTTLLRGAGTSGAVGDGRALKAGIVSDGGKVCRMCGW